MRTTALTLLLISLAAMSGTRVRAQSTSPVEVPSASPSAEPAPPAESAEPLDFTGEAALARESAAAPPPALVAAPVASPPSPPLAERPPLRLNSINLSVLGFVIGAVRLNYERLLSPRHGVFGEAIVTPDVLRGFDFVGYGGAVGYRFHWRGAQNSGFVGATLSVTRASGTTPTFRLGDEDMPDFRGSVWTIGLAPHVGKRWLFERSGVNLTLRVGGGFAYHAVDAWRGSEPDAAENLERSFFIVDGELSVGYSF